MGQTQYVCECPEPYLGGSGCRGQERMELCNPQLAPEYTFGMALPAFCLNGGTCKDVVNRDATVYVKRKGNVGLAEGAECLSQDLTFIFHVFDMLLVLLCLCSPQ